MNATPAVFPLLASKLYPGVGTLHPVPRPRLELPAALREGHATVASIVAPAGYGKSTLMARWYTALGEAGVAGGWLSLDQDDNEPGRFLRYLIAALRNVDGNIGDDALSQLDTKDIVVPAVLLESVAADLARMARRAALFLDDLHLIDNPEVVRIVEWLVNYAPPRIQFILGSREAPHVRLGGLRVRGRLLELDQRRLAFDQDEATRFYLARLDAPPSAHELGQLLHKTEGWPAGLELVALALREEPDHANLIEAFTGTDRGMVDYLGEVVLARLDQATRAFLYQIAQFDRICGKLAQAATGQADAQQRLQALHGRNLFLIALDRDGVWFRFHHLVGDYLRERAPADAAPERAGVLLAGAQWLHQHGQIEDAINCAIRAEAWQEACGWLADTAEETAHRYGAHQVVLRWMREIPSAWIDRFPAIGIHYAFSLVFSPRQAEADQQLAHLERSARALEADPAQTAHAAELRCAVELQRLLLFALRDEGLRARELARAWLQRWPQAGLLQLASAENVLAFGEKSAGDIDAGLAAIDRARGHLLPAAGYYGLVWNDTVAAILQMKRGDYRAAQARCDSGLALVQAHPHGHRGHAGAFHVILAAIAYECGETDTAVKEIEAGLVNVDEAGIADVLILAYLTQARLQFLRADRQAGFAALRQGQQVAHSKGLKRAEVTLAAEECTWLCRLGKDAEAEHLAHRHGFRHPVALGPDWDLHRDKASRVGSRLMLRSAPSHVAAILESALMHCRTQRRYHRAVELLILQVPAWRQANMDDKARAALQEAVQLCDTYGYRRVLLDDLDLLRALMEAPGASPALALPDWIRQALASANPAKSIPMQEALTKRELRILQQLESSLSNREIAESLFISEGTLKWHLVNIYGKLNAGNRSGAIVNARKLGLLAAG